MAPSDEAVGLRSAELVCPYPPGIPTLVPGEVITSAALAELRRLRDAGCAMTGCTDAGLESLAVLVAMAMCYLIWNDPRRVYVGVPPVLMYAVTPATAVLWLRLLARIQPPRVRSSGIA